MSFFEIKGGRPVSDTMFPKREERVPYGGGKPVRSGRGNRREKKQQTMEQLEGKFKIS